MTTYVGCDGLEVVRTGPVLELILDRPATKNAIDALMLDTMVRALDAAAADDEVRVVLLHGQGPDFCTGSDIIAKNAPRAVRPRVGSIQRRLPSEAHRLIAVLTSVPVPVVCAARGWVAGLGLHLALAADFCVATREAVFWEPFVGRGLTTDSGGGILVRRRVGEVRSRRLLLLGERITGVVAAQWGLIHQCVPDADLEAASGDLVGRLAHGPQVVGMTKWLMQGAPESPLEHHLADEALVGELVRRGAWSSPTDGADGLGRADPDGGFPTAPITSP